MLKNEKQHYYIELKQEDEKEQVLRHCSNCGRMVPFQDSYKRRQNANGKNVYEYAIYKCPKGHTWNKKLAIIKAEYTSPETFLHAPEHYGDTSSKAKAYQEQYLSEDTNPIGSSIDVDQLHQSQLTEIFITIEAVQGKWRVDKALATHLMGWSREKIRMGLKQGLIKVNGKCVKPSGSVKAGDTFLISLF